MFDNIGGKIKALAKVFCWLGIIASIISGAAIIVQASQQRYNSGVGILYGVLIIVGGSLISWISSFFTYGFGQLIENTDRIK